MQGDFFFFIVVGGRQQWCVYEDHIIIAIYIIIAIVILQAHLNSSYPNLFSPTPTNLNLPPPILTYPTCIDDQDAIEMGLKMWACDQLSVESKRNKSKVDDKNKDKELQHIQDKSQDPPRAVFGSLSIKLPSQLLSSSDHKQHQHQHHSSFTSGKSTTSSGFGSVGSDDSCTDSNGSTTGEVSPQRPHYS